MFRGILSSSWPFFYQADELRCGSSFSWIVETYRASTQPIALATMFGWLGDGIAEMG